MTHYLPPDPAGSVVTVGTFDGVHRGHVAVLREIVERARVAGRKSVLVTFEPHPLEVVNPKAAPLLLTSGAERREALAQTGLDYVVFLRFDKALAQYSPERFVREVLIGRCGMKELVIGHDHGFGRGRSGDVETLRRLGATDGFQVDVVGLVESGGHAVSSTAIRRAVAGGDLRTAAGLLGRPYTVSGRVVRGEGRGRTIGVPTLNLGDIPERKLLPPDGVYAARVEWARGRAGGMLNQGPRPTVGDGRRSLEVHLFGVDEDLYGEWVKVEWVARIRDQQKFPSLAALQDQLKQDRARAEDALARHDPPMDKSRASHA
ncbi:MAG: bifunctional riboflavin kinase/FAD synthetase [Gemmatimonadetes bacterium]|nr:bifunctional riboflavin kinase/FAD synthetase [Gemmatimonadota bacterium]